jgi:G3E family GTPase
MNNGCICCTVRGDLIRIIEGLMKRKGKFDAIIVETTGLADPGAGGADLLRRRGRAQGGAARRGGDGRRRQMARERLRDAPEAKNQIAFADVIILNKTDLVTPAELREVEARIRAINPYAKLHKAKKCDVRSPRCWSAAPSISTASSTSSRISSKRQSRIVFIGRNLPGKKITEGFESCIAHDSRLKNGVLRSPMCRASR